MNDVARAVRLTRAGRQPVTADGLEVTELGTPRPGAGEVLVRVHHFSLDPYQRIRMRELDTGEVPPAGAVGQVLASRTAQVAEGAWVLGELGWRDLAVVPAEQVEVFEPHPDVPLHHYVGLLGLSGLTAYFGTTEVLRPDAGERIVVSGASGGVGQIAAQVAALLGARVLGIVGSPDKQAALLERGIESVIHRDQDWTEQLEAWAPDGVDGYFDNVWGPVSSRVVERLRPLGRIALCGQMTGLSSGRVPPLDIDWYLLLTRSLRLQGFRAVDYRSRYPEARAALARWYLDGRLEQKVRLVAGLEQAGAAFEDLINARATGKTIVGTGAAPGY
jgi:NADPH-dependent curcumin reductase CurA